MRRVRQAVQTTAVIAAVAGFAVVGRAQTPAQVPSRWVTAWSTSQQGQGTTVVSHATIRVITRVTLGGDAVRVRFDNTYGAKPLTIGRAFVGQRNSGAALVTGSNRPLLFGNQPSTTVAPGGSVVSDPVALSVVRGQDLAVSLYVPENDVRPSQHTGAMTTSYLSPAGSGDVAGDESRQPFTETTSAFFWVKAIDVQTTGPAGAIVAFGDSITDGTCTTLDAHDRWVDWLSVRLGLADSTRGTAKARLAILNEGIGGNTVTRVGLQPAPDSTPGLERVDRDVLSHHGVTHVILFMGTNDIRRNAPASQVIRGLDDIIGRLKGRGLKVIGVTIIPRHDVAASGSNTGWNAEKTSLRREVNDWIRTKAPFDAVIDFDWVVGDPAKPDLMRASYNCDGIHPNPLGYYQMGAAIGLDLFDR